MPTLHMTQEQFLAKARALKLPIQITRSLFWQPSTLSYEDGRRPSSVAASPSVSISYAIQSIPPGATAVASYRFSEHFAGKLDGVGIEVILEGSLHDWLIANANEVTYDEATSQFKRLHADEPERELSYLIARSGGWPFQVF